MPSTGVNFSWRGPTVTLVTLVAAGIFLRPLEKAVPSGLPAAQLKALGGGVRTLAVLGGLRSVVAGGFWLRAHLAWERQDAVATDALLRLTVAADERPLYFWLNGARILAHDLPEWLPPDAPRALRQRISGQQARRALQFLALGLDWHGPSAALYVEMANLYLHQLGDLENAARCYRLAAEQPGAPYYAARIHAELLRRLGRPQAALDWLRGILPGLPPDDPAARREVVVERIKGLELVVAGK